MESLPPADVSEPTFAHPSWGETACSVPLRPLDRESAQRLVVVGLRLVRDEAFPLLPGGGEMPYPSHLEIILAERRAVIAACAELDADEAQLRRARPEPFHTTWSPLGAQLADGFSIYARRFFHAALSAFTGLLRPVKSRGGGEIP